MNYLEKDRAEFKQFAVFDGKSVISHLEQKNEFGFRPAGLSFFADYADAVSRVEQKMKSEIQNKQSENEFALLFDGDSEIKNVIENLSADTKIEDLGKFTPFSEEDNVEKTKIQKQYDEILLASRSKEKQIENLNAIVGLLKKNRADIEALNKKFSTDNLNAIREMIADCIEKEKSASIESVERFNTDKIEGIGTPEWKRFIIAAEVFSKNQKKNENYPQSGDYCLLCHQTLSNDARSLIGNYWTYIRSVAEEIAKKAQATLNMELQSYEKLSFELFPDNNVLTNWMIANHPDILERLKQMLSEQKTLSESIITDIKCKTTNIHSEISIRLEEHTAILDSINESFKALQDDEQNKELEKMLSKKTFIEHKEKLNTHFSKFEAFITNQAWIRKAENANYAKRKITETEKALSNKYFNTKYVDAFNLECQKLNGNFGIEISQTGSAGKTYRQLKLKGKNPNAILSEGEQKVIAIADFIAEMQLSEINRGIIFDDPVTSLDDMRKGEIAKRLVQESLSKQTIVFTHDLVFVSSLIGYCSNLKTGHCCHWIENRDGRAGQIWLNNSPSYEKEYRNANPAKKCYSEAQKAGCSPSIREGLIKSGFTALRTCYEVLVIHDLFKDVVQRFNERVSVDSLSDVYFDSALIEELQDGFAQCCRYMEGHTHSDKYAFKKPESSNLNEEINRYEAIRTKIRKAKQPSA